MPRPLKWGIIGASTIILFKDIDKYAFMCGSNFNETDVTKTVELLDMACHDQLFIFFFLNFLMVSIKIGQYALSSKSGKSNRALLVFPE